MNIRGVFTIIVATGVFALVAALLVVAPPVASAYYETQSPQSTRPGPEGQWHFNISDYDLRCQTTAGPDSKNVHAWYDGFYTRSYCGTFVEVNGKAYGSQGAAGLGFAKYYESILPYTNSVQSNTADSVSTTTNVADTGLQLTQVDRYNAAGDGWVTEIVLRNIGSQTHPYVRLLHVAGTCGSNQNRSRTLDPVSRDTSCYGNWGNLEQTITFQRAAGNAVYSASDTFGHYQSVELAPGGEIHMTSEIVWRLDGTVPTAGPTLPYYGTTDPMTTVGGGSPDTASTQCSCADPVNSATGELWAKTTDNYLPGRLPVETTRAYSSLRHDQEGMFGRGWSTAWDMHAGIDEVGNATITHENGATTSFSGHADGSFGADPDVHATLARTSDGSLVYNRRRDKAYTFDENGDLRSISDRNGEATTISRSGGLVEITSSDGRKILATLNNQGTVARLAAPGGRVTTYGYDAQKRLTTVVDSRSGIRRYEYDSRGRLSVETTPAGAVTRTTYDDATGAAVSQTGPMGGMTTFDYTMNPATGMASSTKVTEPGNVVTVYNYDHGLLASRTVDATGQPATWKFNYDSQGNQKEIISPTGERTFATFDKNGNVLRTTDAAGRVTRYTYNEFNQILTATDDGGRVIDDQFYDERGNQLGFVQPASGGSQITRFELDPNHPADILSVTNPVGFVTRYSRNAAGFVTSETTPDGAVRTYTRNDYGQALAITAPLGNKAGATSGSFKTTYSYDAAGNVTTRTDPLGNASQFSYDADDRLIKSTSADGGVSATAYNADGTVKTITDPLNRATSFTYDKAGRPLTTVRPSGATTTMSYDRHGWLVSEILPAGNAVGATTQQRLSATRTYTNDLDGRAVSVSQPDPADPSLSLTTSTTWVGNQATGVTDPLGRTTTMSYDQADNLVSITDPAGGERRWSYDAANRLNSSNEPGNTGIRYFNYDRAGNLSSEVDGLGQRTIHTYDSVGRRLTSVDPRGNCSGCDAAKFRVDYTYDLNGNKVSEKDQLGRTSTLAYDQNDRVLSRTSANNRKTTYNYDTVGRLLSTTAPDGGVTTYKPDLAGQLTASTNPGLKTTSSTYNADGQLLTRTDPLNRTDSYTYDVTGNRTSHITARGTAAANKAAGTINYTYDSMNHLTKKTFGDGAASVSYGYEKASQLVSRTDAAGAQTRGYDAAGRLTSIARGGATWRYSYNADSTLATVARPDGTTETWTYDFAQRATKVVAPAGTTTFSYDQADNLLRTTNPDGTYEAQTWDAAGNTTGLSTRRGTTTLVSHTIQRDNVNNPVQVSTTRGSTTSTRSYLYDANERLTAVCYTALSSCTSSSAATQAWTYDKNGNRLTEKNGTGTGTGTTYSYNGADQLTSTKVGSAAAVASVHDPDGNLTAQGTTTWTYDLEDKASSTTSGSTKTTWTRDADGNPLTQAVGSAATNYDWDVNREVPQLATIRVGTTTTEYRYDPVGRPMAMAQGATRQSIGHDLRGAPIDLISSSGAVVRSYDYTPFGTARTAAGGPSSPTGVPSHLQFGSMLIGPASSYLTQARVYDTASGRFGGVDPAAPPATRAFDSTYNYVGNQPTLYLDPLGKICNPNPFSSSKDVCGLYDDIADAMTGNNAASFIVEPITTGIVNFGRGASFGLSDKAADAISAGSSCTVTSKGLLATTSQFLGMAATIPLGEGIFSGTIGSVRTATAKTIASGTAANTGGKASVLLGQAGENAVRGAYDLGSKASASIGGRRRIFDGLTDTTVSEVKNVARQSYTSQLRDSLSYARSTGRTFDLYVRQDTYLTGPLQSAIARGDISLRFIP